MNQYLIYAIMLAIGISIGMIYNIAALNGHRKALSKASDHIKQRNESDREFLGGMYKKDIQITDLMKDKIDADFEKRIKGRNK